MPHNNICEYHENCSFYNRPKKTSSVKMLVTMFCKANAHRCEIFKRLEAGKSISEGITQWDIIPLTNDFHFIPGIVKKHFVTGLMANAKINKILLFSFIFFEYNLTHNMDINEILYLKKLNNILLENKVNHLQIETYFSKMGIEENHFLNTIRKLDKLKIIEMGSGSKSKFIKVYNWNKIPLQGGNLMIRITSIGKKALKNL